MRTNTGALTFTDLSQIQKMRQGSNLAGLLDEMSVTRPDDSISDLTVFFQEGSGKTSRFFMDYQYREYASFGRKRRLMPVYGTKGATPGITRQANFVELLFGMESDLWGSGFDKYIFGTSYLNGEDTVTLSDVALEKAIGKIGLSRPVKVSSNHRERLCRLLVRLWEAKEKNPSSRFVLLVEGAAERSMDIIRELYMLIPYRLRLQNGFETNIDMADLRQIQEGGLPIYILTAESGVDLTKRKWAFSVDICVWKELEKLSCDEERLNLVRRLTDIISDNVVVELDKAEQAILNQKETGISSFKYYEDILKQLFKKTRQFISSTEEDEGIVADRPEQVDDLKQVVELDEEGIFGTNAIVAEKSPKEPVLKAAYELVDECESSVNHESLDVPEPTAEYELAFERQSENEHRVVANQATELRKKSDFIVESVRDIAVEPDPMPVSLAEPQDMVKSELIVGKEYYADEKLVGNENPVDVSAAINPPMLHKSQDQSFDQRSSHHVKTSIHENETITRLKREKTELEETRIKLLSESQVMKNKLRALSEEAERLRTEIMVMETDKDGLSRSHSSAEKEIRKLSEQRRKLKSENEQLTKANIIQAEKLRKVRKKRGWDSSVGYYSKSHIRPKPTYEYLERKVRKLYQKNKTLHHWHSVFLVSAIFFFVIMLIAWILFIIGVHTDEHPINNTSVRSATEMQTDSAEGESVNLLEDSMHSNTQNDFAENDYIEHSQMESVLSELPEEITDSASETAEYRDDWTTIQGSSPGVALSWSETTERLGQPVGFQTYYHIRFALDKAGTGISEDSTLPYLGVYVNHKPNDTDLIKYYQWQEISTLDPAKGIRADWIDVPGIDYYLHIAYAADEDGIDFSTKDSTDRSWVGWYISGHAESGSSADSTNFADYTWILR